MFLAEGRLIREIAPAQVRSDIQQRLDEIVTDGNVIERGVGLLAMLAEGLAEGVAGRGNDSRGAVSLPVETATGA